jgi:hypothetical protein
MATLKVLQNGLMLSFHGVQARAAEPSRVKKMLAHQIPRFERSSLSFSLRVRSNFAATLQRSLSLFIPGLWWVASTGCNDRFDAVRPSTFFQCHHALQSRSLSSSIVCLLRFGNDRMDNNKRPKASFWPTQFWAKCCF